MFSEKTRPDSAPIASKSRWLTRLLWLLPLLAGLWLTARLLKLREAESVRLEIEALGGQIEYAPAHPGLATSLLQHRSPGQVKGVMLAKLQHFDPAWATTFPDLELLSVFNIRMTSHDLDELKNLPRLKTLNLLQVHLEGQELRRLAKLPALQELRLSDVMDQALPQLAGCHQLKILRVLGAPKVTDQGLARMPLLPRLEYLQLVQTGVTPSGIEEFKQRFPNVEVQYQSEP